MTLYGKDRESNYALIKNWRIIMNEPLTCLNVYSNMVAIGKNTQLRYSNMCM